jgi:Rhodopirellula transposase DDE domain
MSGRVVSGRPRSRPPLGTVETRSCPRRPGWRGRRSETAGGRSCGRPDVEETQPGVTEALDLLVEPLTRGDPMSPLRWTCKSRAKLTAALTAQGWRVSSTTVGHLLHALGYRLQALRKTQEGTSHPDRNAQFEHINAAAAAFLNQQQPRSPSIRRRRNWSAISRRRGGNGSRRARLSPSACTIFPATRSAKPSRTASMTWRATKRG